MKISSQKRLAEFLDVDKSTMNAWMKLRRSPSMDNLLRIAEKTGWSIDRLVGNVAAGMALLEPLCTQVNETATALSTLLPDRALMDRVRREPEEEATGKKTKKKAAKKQAKKKQSKSAKK